MEPPLRRGEDDPRVVEFRGINQGGPHRVEEKAGLELVVPPLELVELRARLNEPQFFRRTAEETAVAVVLADLALQGKPERRRRGLSACCPFRP